MQYIVEDLTRAVLAEAQHVIKMTAAASSAVEYDSAHHSESEPAGAQPGPSSISETAALVLDEAARNAAGWAADNSHVPGTASVRSGR